MKARCTALKRDTRPARRFAKGEKESWISLLDQTSDQFTAEEWASKINITLDTLRHWAPDYGWKFKPISAEDISLRIKDGLERSEQWEQAKYKKRGSPRVKNVDIRRKRIKQRLLQSPATLGELAKLIGATKSTAKSLARSIGANSSIQLGRNVAGKPCWVSIWNMPARQALMDERKTQGCIAAK